MNDSWIKIKSLSISKSLYFHLKLKLHSSYFCPLNYMKLSYWQYLPKWQQDCCIMVNFESIFYIHLLSSTFNEIQSKGEELYEIYRQFKIFFSHLSKLWKQPIKFNNRYKFSLTILCLTFEKAPNANIMHLPHKNS